MEVKQNELFRRLQNHDWYYGYSDDHSVWKAGLNEEKKLNSIISDLSCPYSIAQLRMAVQNMVVEEFVEESPGEWYRHPRKYKNIAPTGRPDLIHRADQVQILAWIEIQKIGGSEQ
tara:strand:- start:65 stop:412 length:348 start_codon:yes stop_codon:yes gene_type:complete